MIYVSLKNNSILSIMILRLNKVQEVSYLESDFFSFLEIIDILQKKFDSFVSIKNYEAYYQRQTQKVKLQGSTEFSIFKDFGNKKDEIAPEEVTCQDTKELVHALIEIRPMISEIRI